MSKKIFVLTIVLLTCVTVLITVCVVTGQVEVAKSIANVVGIVAILAYLKHDLISRN